MSEDGQVRPLAKFRAKFRRRTVDSATRVCHVTQNPEIKENRRKSQKRSSEDDTGTSNNYKVLFQLLDKIYLAI